jgi:hypothetical protein
MVSRDLEQRLSKRLELSRTGRFSFCLAARRQGRYEPSGPGGTIGKGNGHPLPTVAVVIGMTETASFDPGQRLEEEGTDGRRICSSAEGFAGPFSSRRVGQGRLARRTLTVGRRGSNGPSALRRPGRTGHLRRRAPQNQPDKRLGNRSPGLARQQLSTALTRVPPTMRLLACPSVRPLPDWALTKSRKAPSGPQPLLARLASIAV